jgi:hypothetical protein
MYQFKGFASLSSLASNITDIVAPIGELSATSATFAKDVKLYASPATEVVLHGFSSKSSLSGKIAAPDLIVQKAMSICDWVATRQKSILAGEIAQDFKLALTQQFASTCTSFTCGSMIIANNGHPYPAWISWKSLDYVADDNLNTIWFSDDLFKKQYDEYEIVVIPPLSAIDAFFGTYAEVTASLDRRTYIQLFGDISVARAGYPETILTSQAFDFINALNTAVVLPTNWAFLIYGPRGNDTDAIKTALIAYIQRNSTRNLNLWRTIFPDIFKSTEFVLIPKWNQYAIAEMTLQVGIYSPVLGLKDELAYLKRAIADYPSAHIDQYACTMGYPYRSMSMSVVGNPDNRGNKYKLTDFFPDLIAVSSTSLDFNRMSALTQGFLTKLADLVYLAETATLYSDLSAEYKKTIRSGILYLSMSYNNITFLVSTKASTPI